MADSEKKQSFWTTLPGFLTGIAALLTAVTGLLVVMYPHGLAGPKDTPAAGSATEPARAASSAGGGSGASAAPAARQRPTVLVTAKDGTETRVSLNSFRDSYSGEAIELKNGQSIPFEKIGSVDFLQTHDYEQDVRVTLTDGRALKGGDHVGRADHG